MSDTIQSRVPAPLSSRALGSEAFQHLIQSNEPPTHYEENSIRATVVHMKIELANLQERAEGEDTQPSSPSGSEEIYEECNKMSFVICQLQSTLSAVRRIPTELWLEILESVCEERIVAYKFYTSGLHWDLGRVCSLWRGVSWRLSAFSLIELNTNYGHFVYHTKNALSVLPLILERTGESRLSIVINVGLQDPSIYEGIIGGAMDLLCSHSCRWRSLKISSPKRCHWEKLATVKGRLSSLESLTLDRYPDDDLTFDGFALAPSLRTLQISPEHDVRSDLGTFRIPLSQITQYTAYTYSAWRHLALLHEMHNIVVCDISYPTDNHPTDEPKLSQLSQLKRLKLGARGTPGGAENFLDHLVLPALEDVEVTGYLHVPSFCRLLKTSRSPLTSLDLCLDSNPDRGANLLSILQVAPALRKLQIQELALSRQEVRDAVNVVDHLMVSLATDVVPNLESFIVTTPYLPKDEFDRHIIAMVDYRWKTSHHMARLPHIRISLYSIHWPWPKNIIDTKVVRRLKSFRKTGMDITLEVNSLSLLDDTSSLSEDDEGAWV